ncbi:MAG: zinc ribbon domain-containing protein [Clostridia bacterium]|nr:zinc ribbon domain-containing protein [Clostridia bacterium]
MNKKLCNYCGTENEQHYKYCKNCGNEFPHEREPAAPQFTETTNFVPTPPPMPQPQVMPNNRMNVIDNISGIPTEEVALFVGRKANDILPKFSKMELANSKVSWCWPVAILGAFLGPIGAACWFFYRKMYKPALLLSAIGAVIHIAVIILSGDNSINTSDFLSMFAFPDYEEAMGSLSLFAAQGTIWQKLAYFIDIITSLLTCLLCGLFAFNSYKNHCVEKINYYRTIQADGRYYKLGLAAIGGVSGGMIALGVVIYVLASILGSIAYTVVSALF